jgi:hypothetical protein
MRCRRLPAFCGKRIALPPTTEHRRECPCLSGPCLFAGSGQGRPDCGLARQGKRKRTRRGLRSGLGGSWRPLAAAASGPRSAAAGLECRPIGLKGDFVDPCRDIGNFREFFGA